MNLPVGCRGSLWKLAVIGTGLLAMSQTAVGQSASKTRPNSRYASPQVGSKNSRPTQSVTRTVPKPSAAASHERVARSSVRVLREPPAPATPDVPDTMPESVPESVPEEVRANTPGLPPDVIFEGDSEPWVTDSPECGPACGHYGGCLIPCPSLCFQNTELFVGSQGFTGPVNRGQTGSFGFHEGVNWGAPLPCLGCGELGMQFGMRAAQSNLSGAEFTTDERHQTFVTGGLFRRVDWGFQGGLVVDYLHDLWYYEADLIQLRGELSWVYPCNHEVGVWFTSSNQSEDIVSTLTVNRQTTTTDEVLNPTDLYAFFYRHRLDDCSAANGRLYAGFTGKGDGLIGADVQTPINDCWAFQSSFTYLVPKESTGDDGHVEESWNFGLSLAWRPGGGFMSQNYYRPLFNVADNGTFMVDRQ